MPMDCRSHSSQTPLLWFIELQFNYTSATSDSDLRSPMFMVRHEVLKRDICYPLQWCYVRCTYAIIDTVNYKIFYVRWLLTGSNNLFVKWIMLLYIDVVFMKNKYIMLVFILDGSISKKLFFFYWGNNNNVICRYWTLQLICDYLKCL